MSAREELEFFAASCRVITADSLAPFIDALIAETREEAATAVEDKAAAVLAEIDEDELNPSDHDRYQEWLDAATCVRQAGNTAKADA